MRHQPRPSLVQIMAWRKTSCIITNWPLNMLRNKLQSNYFAFENGVWKMWSMSRAQCVKSTEHEDAEKVLWLISPRDIKYYLNPLCAKFFRGNKYIYLHFVSFLHIDTTQIVEILPQIRQEPTYSTQSISLLLMSWRRKEPGHQQPWYWPSWTKITRSPHVKGKVGNFQTEIKVKFLAHFMWNCPQVNVVRHNPNITDNLLT